MKYVFILILAHFFTSAQCYYKNNKEWNDLKVTFGLNASDPRVFNSLPRTVQDAVNRGWKRDVGCTEGFRGNRFTLNNDKDVFLIFDANGLIAGLATSVKKGPSSTNPFSFPSKEQQLYYDEEGDYWTFSTYFTDPNKVCQKNLLGSWLWDGTGDRLVFSSKKAFIQVPLKENELNQTLWTQGRCFKGMGMHYWLQLDGKLNKDSKRDSLFPVFLLYNRGKLNGFGWFWNSYLTSSRIEPTPAQLVAGTAIELPSWMFDSSQAIAPLSSIHIYLDNTPASNAC